MPAWTFRVGLGVAVVAVAFAVTDAALGPRPGVTQANVRRLKPGMTQEEVRAVLGGPAEWQLGLSLIQKGGGEAVYKWTGAEGEAFVTFRFGLRDDYSGTLTSVSFQRTAPPGLLDRLCSWLGR